jgi:cellulose synthase operon protein C
LSLAESDLLSNRLAEAKAMFDELRLSEKSDATVRERATFQLIVIALEQRQWEDVTKLGQDFTTAFPQSGSLPYVKYALAEATLANPKATTEQLENLLTNIAALIPQLPTDSAEWAPRLWVLAAEAQFRLKRYDDIAATVADFKQKQAENPLTYQVEEVLGRALKQQARFDEARATLERVVDDEAAFRTETAAKSQFLIAETWFLQEKWKEALLAYQKVYASYAYPEWQSAALLQSGKCDEQMGNLKDAIASYDRMISEFPKSTHLEEARMRLMQAKLKTGTTP